MDRATGKLTYANVVSTLALFLALTGATAFAAGKVGTKEIKVGAVKSKSIARNAVKSQKVARGAIRQRHIKANAVGYKQIAPNSIDGTKVIDGSLTAADVVGGASVATTASGGPTEITSLSQNAPNSVPLANAGWVQSPTQTNLFAARLVVTVQDIPEATDCQLFVEVKADNQVIGAFSVKGAGASPTTIVEEQLLSGARVPLGTPRPSQLTATAHTGELLNSCQTARVDLLQVVVLGIG